MKVIVSGCAGFIGSNLVDKLLDKDFLVVGIDNFNDYYDPKIKRENLKGALANSRFKLCEEDILNESNLFEIFESEKPGIVVHLAARAGVRPSILNPLLYAKNNVLGTINMLSCSVKVNVLKFIFGSSSSVYGESKSIPFSEDDICQNIVSPYASSKRSAEFFVESFYHCFGLKSIILRFFTVYGKRGRPDMSPAIFTKLLLEDIPLDIFGNGDARRDFTYIEDATEAILKAMDCNLKFEVFNIGGNKPVTISEFVRLLQKETGSEAKIVHQEKALGDVSSTWAKIDKAKRLLNWKPKVLLKEGIGHYVAWCKYS